MNKSAQHTFPSSPTRVGSVLAATVAFLIAASSNLAAQTSSHETHHPDGPPQAAAPAQEMPQGGVTQGGMMQGGGMMSGMMQGGMMGMMGNCPTMGVSTASHTEGRIAFLKAELAITDQQKEAWEAYAAAIKKNLEGMKTARGTMMTAMQAISPVERLDTHIATMESRVAALKELKPALSTLYAALSEEQKKKADELLTGMGCMM
jgi:hypothetical protein